MALLQRLRWRLKMLRFALTVRPVMGGAPGEDAGKGGDDKGGDDDAGKGGDDKGGDDDAGKGGDDKGGDDDKITSDDDWKSKSRKNENRAKKAEKEAADLRERLEKIEDQNKSEQEKALDEARKQAREEALSEAEKERRTDRLEVAVTRMAAKGVTVKDGDEEKTVKFADPEDALAFVSREDTDDLFSDEGKVDEDALTDALVDLAKRKPHLTTDGKAPPPDSDARKGETTNSDLEAMSPDDHAKRKYGENK